MSNIFTHWFRDSTIAPVSNEAAIESAIRLEKALDESYDCFKQLSRRNSEGICNINKLCQNLGLPILSSGQLRNIQYLLAGNAGERLVSQAVNTVAGPEKIVIHNVVLPYQYGQLGSNLDNQIDNLVITDTGIYCVEAKARTIQNGVFDFQNLAPDIYKQIGYHKEALLKCLAKVNINLNSRLVRTIVVVVDRNGSTNFEIINQGKLNGLGSAAVSLDELVLLLTNGLGNFYLNPTQINKIASAIRNSRVKSNRKYLSNVRFNLTKEDVGRIRQLSLAVNYQLPIEQIITYNSTFNNWPLTGLNARLQDMYWYIIGELYSSGSHKTTFTRKELKTMASQKERNYTRLDSEIATLANFMQKMEMFSKVEYHSGEMTIVVKETYLPLFNGYSDDYCMLSYPLLKQIKYNYAKTLFRLLLQRAKEGRYEVSIEDFRRIMAIPPGYKSVTCIVKKSVKALGPFYEGLTCEYAIGRSNKVTGLAFTFNAFNPEDLLKVV